jgi:hypothetical protein
MDAGPPKPLAPPASRLASMPAPTPAADEAARAAKAALVIANGGTSATAGAPPMLTR